MNGEFAQLPKNAIGMIAFLYRPLEYTGRQFYYGNSALDIVKHPTDNNKFAQVYWAKPVLTVTGRHYQVFDNTLNFATFLLKPFWRRWWLILKSKFQ